MSAQDINDWIASLKLPVLPPPEFVLELPAPVKPADREYDRLVLHPPKVVDVRRAGEFLKGGVTDSALHMRNIQIIASCAEVPPPVIEALRYDSYQLALEYVSSFLSYGRRTGET